MKTLGSALALVTALGLLAATPVAAGSGCGNRGDFIRGSRSLTVFGLTADQRLVRFRECRPEKLAPVGSVAGLQTPDTALVGIDFRVQDGQLYGVGNGGGIYTIDTSTAAATLMTQLTQALDPNAAFFGVDFNPAANALRIIGDTGQNLRHPFAGPLQFQTQIDGPLSFPPPAPSGNVATGVTGAAYTNNDLDAATGTTLFDIDTSNPNGNQVVIQSPANSGTLVATGKLTVDPDSPVGFDIYSVLRDGAVVTNLGFASLVVDGVTGFYRINLLTGQAILIDPFDESIIDVAILLTQP